MMLYTEVRKGVSLIGLHNIEKDLQVLGRCETGRDVNMRGRTCRGVETSGVTNYEYGEARCTLVGMTHEWCMPRYAMVQKAP
jgi:hypothetical protein